MVTCQFEFGCMSPNSIFVCNPAFLSLPLLFLTLILDISQFISKRNNSRITNLPFFFFCMRKTRCSHGIMIFVSTCSRSLKTSRQPPVGCFILSPCTLTSDVISAVLYKQVDSFLLPSCILRQEDSWRTKYIKT